MPLFKGVGGRIKQRLLDLGYVKANGDLRVADFAMDHRFPGSFVYDWIADRRTPFKDLDRLATALQTTPAWLCFGVSEVVAPQPSAKPTGRARRADRVVPTLPARQAKKLTPQPQRRGTRRVAALSGGSAEARALPVSQDSDSIEQSASYQTLQPYPWGGEVDLERMPGPSPRGVTCSVGCSALTVGDTAVPVAVRVAVMHDLGLAHECISPLPSSHDAADRPHPRGAVRRYAVESATHRPDHSAAGAGGDHHVVGADAHLPSRASVTHGGYGVLGAGGARPLAKAPRPGPFTKQERTDKAARRRARRRV